MIRFAKSSDVLELERIMKETGLATEGVSYKEWTPPVLVAEVDGKVVGLIQAYVSQPLPMMSQFAVLPEYQGKGIGKELADGMELVFQTLGIKQYVAIADKKKDRLMRGYQKRGMEFLSDVGQWIRRMA